LLTLYIKAGQSSHISPKHFMLQCIYGEWQWNYQWGKGLLMVRGMPV